MEKKKNSPELTAVHASGSSDTCSALALHARAVKKAKLVS